MRNKKIEFFPDVFVTYRMTYSGIDTLLRISWFPVLLVTIVIQLGVLAVPDTQSDVTVETAITGNLLIYLVVTSIATLMMQAIVSVAWLRDLCGFSFPQDTRFYFRFGIREFRYTLVLLLITVFLSVGFGTAVAGMVLWQGSVVAQLLALVFGPLLGLYIIARSILVLPMAALDRPVQVLESWRMTRSSGARISLILVVLTIPVVAVQTALSQLTLSLIRLDPGWLLLSGVNFVSLIVVVLISATITTALCVILSRLVNNNQIRFRDS